MKTDRIANAEELSGWFEEFRRLNPERWWWKYQRGAVRVCDFFRYDIYQGVRNLVLFFPVVWRWRAWSHEYDYNVFMRAIALHRESHARNHSHEHWQRSVAGMDLTLRRWEFIQKTDDWEMEKKVWDLMHDHLKNNAEGWWD